MRQVKAGRELINLIKLCHRADRPVLVSGPHGIGKSELLKAAAKELSIGFICRDLSLMEPTDLVGLPKTNGKTTRFLPPAFLPTSGSGLFAIEELNRADRHMRAPCLQLLTERTLNDYRLPDGWLPVAAVNPTDNGNYDVEVLDRALLSRFVCVDVVADREEWLKWAEIESIHQAVIAYVNGDDEVFDDSESNPRAWSYVSSLLHAAGELESFNRALRTAVIGLVGEVRGTAFLSTLCNSDWSLTVDQILDSYATSHRRTVRRWITDGRLDLVDSLLRSLKVHLQPRSNFAGVHADRSRKANMALFLYDLPGDQLDDARSFFRDRKYPFPPRPRKR